MSLYLEGKRNLKRGSSGVLVNLRFKPELFQSSDESPRLIVCKQKIKRKNMDVLPIISFNIMLFSYLQKLFIPTDRARG